MEPRTWTVVRSAALTEASSFSMSKREVISWWRTRGDDAPATDEMSLPMADARVVGFQLKAAAVDRHVTSTLEADIRTLRGALAPYVDEAASESVDGANRDLFAVVDGLRLALEAVLDQRIRSREATDTVATAEIDVELVASYVAGVCAPSITGGRLAGKVRADSVEAGGEVYGVGMEWSAQNQRN